MHVDRRLSRTLTRHRYTVDLVAVVALLPLVVLAPAELLNIDGLGTHAGWAAAIVAPLAVRRRWPVTSAVAVFAVGALKLLLGPGLLFPADLAVLVALYSVTVHGPRWAGRAAMGGVVVGALGLGIRAVVTFGLGDLIIIAVVAMMLCTLGAATWGFALLRRSRTETLEALRDRADRLENERDQQAQLAAVAERARIAREMHDVVAHSLSIVIAQADGGRYAAQRDPGAAVHALDTIGQTGRAALADMRRILGVLRGDPVTTTNGHGVTPAEHPNLPGDTPASAIPLAPQPDIEDLGGLLERVRTAGVHVSTAEVGQARMLPPGMELTVFRIIQEALTNVLKHAGPQPTVTLLRRWHGQTLTIDITDDGRGAAADTSASIAGHGLVGMRERAALFNGTVHAGPRDGGGFRVHVELPLPGTDADRQPIDVPSGDPL